VWVNLDDLRTGWDGFFYSNSGHGLLKNIFHNDEVGNFLENKIDDPKRQRVYLNYN